MKKTVRENGRKKAREAWGTVKLHDWPALRKRALRKDSHVEVS